LTQGTGHTSANSLVDFWKARYQRQKLLIASITSLLNKYGTSLDTEHLHSAFLLTLMGHYVVSDACYYTSSADGSELFPALAYGRAGLDQLPFIPSASPIIREVEHDHTPRLVTSLPLSVLRGPLGTTLSTNYAVLAPLRIKTRLVGLLLLGKKVSGQAYGDLDFEVLYALCAASATTFNNANLYHNARLSAREVERLYEVRSEVISRVSHEFRTPLTGIRATVELMKAGKKSPAHYDILLGSVNRLEELINSLLELGRDRLEEASNAIAAYDPVTVAQESITRYTNSARRRDIGFVFSQDVADRLPSPRLSPENFLFVLDALLDNAVKFSPDKSRVEISFAQGDGVATPEREGLRLPDWLESTRALLDAYSGAARGVELDDSIVSLIESGDEAEPAVRPARRYLVVRVADAGIGIPEAEISEISEPFRQASNSPDVGVKGRGLGLAVVQKIVASSGGSVFCRSGDGNGTTMTLFLPAD